MAEAPSDPFDRWKAGKPFGSFRQTDHGRGGVVPVPVIRDQGYRTFPSNHFFAQTQTTSDGLRVLVSFDHSMKQRDVVFQRASVAEQAAFGEAPTDLPPNSSGTIQEVVIELCTVEMGPSLAAQLARSLIERLVVDAPEALKAVGLDFRPNADG